MLTPKRLSILILLTTILLACDMRFSVLPPDQAPAPTETVAEVAPPTETPPPTDTPPPPTPSLPIDEIANLAVKQLLDQGLIQDETAFIDSLGHDFAERRIINAYSQVSPSVVNITTRILRRNFFYEIVPEEGAGSGFVLDKDGYIVTNYHVIKDARQVEVTFLDETTVPAKIIGSDPRNDIALLQVEASPDLLVPVQLGNSSDLVVGQRTIVIGNPFGQFGGTLTTGVISALNRSIEGQDGRQISGIIQTDAAINSGNSGGPLLDSSGRVIGINTAIFSPSGTNAGVGFSIPVDTLRRVLPDIREYGHYRHPWLGIRYAYRITPALADSLKLPVEQGLLLVEIHRGGPLNMAKVKGASGETVIGNQRIYTGGDILTAVDGQEVTTLDALNVMLETRHQVGDVVNVTVIQKGEEQTLPIELSEEPTG
jgi:S1-C subfamily serine protease